MDYVGKAHSASDVPMDDMAANPAAPDFTGQAQMLASGNAGPGLPHAAQSAAAAPDAGGGAIILAPDANNVVILPDGATLDNLVVRGRDLVIETADGHVYIIPDGAVFVPQIVAQGVTVPPLNLAALLIGHEPQPAAGPVRSSGGNFEVPVGPLQDAYNLGNLLPYTELAFPQPRALEIFPPRINHVPTTIIITPDQPTGAVAATASVNEAGLPARGSEPEGSNSASNSETTTGTIEFVAQDGLASITLNGVAITAVGQTFTTARGVLTITSIAPGNYGYSYTLTDNTSGDNTSDDFQVVVTDTDGDTASATLTIHIIDDVPTARNDTDAVAAGTYGPETGNVLTGAGTTSGAAGADTQGADGAAISGFRAGTSGAFGAVGSTIVGTYGTLTLTANGGYTYARNPGTQGGVSDVFSYQLTDGDGDTSTATLTISIGDAAPRASENATVLLDDDALAGGNPGGTGDDTNAANTTGTLGASGGDGPLTWALSTSGAPAGFSYVANGTGIDVFQGAVKVMTVTLNAATGAYTVTQLAPIVHAAGGDENNQAFTLSYTATDQDGDSATGTLSINVDDDTPTATNDTNALASGSYGPVTGNVYSNDSIGADGAAASGPVTAITGFGGAGTVGGTTVGHYGTLTLNADGTYSYTRNAGTAGGVSDTFTYTITDKDGDTATATLVISIADARPSAGENATVLLDDDALAGGNPGGTGDDTNAANTSGTLVASGGDGPLTWALSTSGAPAGFSYVANGTGIDVFQGATKVMAITLNTATGAYTVTQLAPIDHSAGGDENNQGFTLSYTATDQDGDAANGTLAISVDDDTPTAINDINALLAGATGPATGNVLTNDSIGADGPAAGGAVTAITGFGGAGTIGGSTTGQYGTLTLNADGTYSYVRSGSGPISATDTFTYTITDHDGDTATATLTITLEDSAPITGRNATVLLDDDALAGGNPGGTGDDADAANTSGTLAASGGDGALTWALSTSGAPAGFSYVANGTGIDVFQGATKVMTVTLNAATGAYTVTQVAPIDHAAGLDENNSGFSLNYTVTDADGDSAGGTLSINVDDDTPTATNDVNAILSGSNAPITGNVYSNDSIGADGPSVSGPVTAITGFGGAGTVGGTTTGHYGTLTLNADGTYTYTRSAGTPGNVTDTFTYTITDHDGDTATATLTITIEDAVPVVGTNQTVLLDDDALAGGNPGGTGDTVDAANTSGTLSGSGGDGALTWAYQTTGAPAGFSYVANGTGIDVFQGATKVLVLTLNAATGAYSVSQVAPIVHAAGGDENNQGFTLNYTVTDADGDATPGTLSISVNDDTPIAANDSNALAAGTYGPVTGNVYTNDSIGADGPSASGPVTAITGFGGAGTVGGTTTGHYGTLTLNANGTYSYTRSAGTQGGVSDTFTYTITDKDGDTTTATLTITIADANPLTSANATVLIDDDALAGGNPGGTGDTVDAANTSGTLAASGGDGPLTWAYSTTGAPAGFTYVANGTGIDVFQGATKVLVLTLNTATGAYSVTQVAPIVDAPGSNENNQAFTINYSVSDQDSDTATGTLTISVNDDTPTATNDVNALLAGAVGPATGNVYTNDSIGADGPSASGPVTAITGFGGAGTVGGTTTGQYGTLTLNANGTYSYVRSGSGPINATDTFTYTITDKDGDTATATLTITLQDAAPSTAGNLTVLLDDDALAGGNPGGTGDTVNAANTSGTLAGSGGDGALTWAYQTTGAPAGFSYVANGTGIDVFQGATKVLTVTLNAATGAYVVTQVAPIVHAAGGDENNQAFTLGYTVTDADGDSASGSLSISVNDDTPIAANDSNALAAGTYGPVTGNVYTNDSIGADGPSASGPVTAITGFGGAGTVGGTTAGHYGTLTLNADGTYSYTRSAGTQGGVTDTFTYTITDKDGDTTTATLTITINDATPVTGANATVLLDDDALAGGIAGGTGDVSPDTANTSGTLAGSGGDAALTWAYSTGGAPAGFSYVANGTGIDVFQGATKVIAITLNAATGAYTVTQLAPINHAAGGAENNQAFTLNYTVTDVDGDSAPGTLAISVNDDSPVVAASTTQPVLTVDETTLGTDASASFASVFTSSFGADGAAAGGGLAYTLGVVAGPSGLIDVATGQAVNLVLNGTVVEGRTAISNALVFTVSVDAGGTVTLDQIRAIQHSPDTGPNQSVSLSADNLITLTATATDKDGDASSATANIGQNLTFLDDAPTITSATTPLAIVNSGSVSGTGNFVFSTGSDGPAAGNDAIKDVTFSGTVNGVAVSASSITAGAETATTATYTFSFTYSTGASTTATDTGVLTFDKVAGTYTVDLDNPIQGYSINQTASGSAFQGYELGTTTIDNTQPAVAVTTITPNLFIQYTGINGTSSTANYSLVSPATGDGVGGSYANGELFTASASWVSVSNSSNGVAGDTVGGDEILDFNLYNTDPKGVVGTPTGSADAMFLKFDGIGSNEDFIVVLKLYDSTTGTYTTKALMVQNSDIQKGSGTGPGIYSGITLDNNDGLIVIESNDYNTVGEHWQIVGAQIVVDPLSITGTAINFNNAIGAGGASTGTQSFATDVNTGAPMKISSIGFVTNSTTAQTAELTFNVTVQDADGDTAAQTLVVNVGSTPPIALDLNGDGVQFLSTSAGVTFDYAGNGSPVGTAWVDKNDGLLAIDLNHNGKVDNGSEIVFGANGQTDLQGLAAQYDSNGDGKLSAADAAFAQFGVWQDANSNGVSDPGEFKSLSEMGIISISLKGDGVAYTAAGGDVAVAGSTTYTKADGSTGTVADVSFALTELQRQAAQPNELMAINAAATGLLAAMALEQANAGSWGQPEAAHNLALAPVAVTLTDGGDLPAPAAIEPVQHAAQTIATVTLPESGHADFTETFRDQVDTIPLTINDAGLNIAGDDGQKSALFDFSGPAHGAMDALLSVGSAGPAQAAVTTQALPVVAEAMSDAAGNHLVDGIVGYFTNGLADAHNAPSGGDFALQGLLNSSVSGSGSDMAHFTMMPALDHDQLATVA